MEDSKFKCIFCKVTRLLLTPPYDGEWWLGTTICALLLVFLGLEVSYLFLILLGPLWLVTWLPYLRLSMGCPSDYYRSLPSDDRMLQYLRVLITLRNLRESRALTEEELRHERTRASLRILGRGNDITTLQLDGLLRTEYFFDGKPSERALREIVDRLKEKP